MTVRELLQERNDPTSGSDRRSMEDGECVGGPELRLLNTHGHQWSWEGHPDATPQEQVQVKSEKRGAKTKCYNQRVGSPRPQPWGWKK